MSTEMLPADGQEDGMISTLVEDQVSESPKSGIPSCEKCGAPIAGHESLACRQCGWYASIGSFVEIDKSWELATDPEMATESSADQTKLPQWAWILMGCIAGVIIESVAIRLLTVEGSILRTNWSLTQLYCGTGLFAACHTIAFALLMKATSDTNLTDIFLHPIQSWSLVLREMPKRQWVCYAGFSGITAAFMSIIVIGGLPYERLLDWGTKPPPKQSLLGAVMSQAQKIEADDNKSLEESIADFAGSQNLDDDGKKKKPKPKPMPRVEEDCIILGYQVTSDGLIYSLLLGGEHYGKLVYSGKVSLKIPVEENRKLAEELTALKSHRPYIKVPVDEARWVRPQYVCRVSYRRKGKQGGLFDLELVDLRGIVELKGN